MENNRTRRKLILACALLLLSLARTAVASMDCCPAAVSACDGKCEGHGGQWSCELGFEWVGCYCNDATHHFGPPVSVCGG
jgi:hypothetical protein